MKEEAFIEWYEKFFSSLDELGYPFQDDDIALNLFPVNYEIQSNWEKDIYLILDIVRHLSIKQLTNRLDIRPEHKQLLDLYREKEWLPLVARPDTIITKGQPKIIELNYDSSAIEGIYEIEIMLSHLAKSPLNIDKKYNWLSGKQGFIKFISDYFNTYSIQLEQQYMAIIIDNEMSRYDKDIAEKTSNWISQNTHYACFVRMHEMLWSENDFITDGEYNYSLLYQYNTLLDAHYKTKTLEELIEKTANTKTRIISDPKDISVDCKWGLVLLNEYAQSNICSYNEKELINKYIPLSFDIKTKEILIDNKLYNVKKLLIEKQNDFVIKRTHSFYGKHVFIGKLSSKSEWINLIEYSQNNKTEAWIAQEYIKSDLFNFKYFDSSKQDFYQLDRRFVLSPYFLGKSIASILIRVEKDEKNSILRRLTDGNMGVAFVGNPKNI